MYSSLPKDLHRLQRRGAMSGLPAAVDCGVAAQWSRSS